MKNNINVTKIFLWVVTVIMVFFVWLFIVFSICGVSMAIFKVKEDLVMAVHTFFSLPVSVVCAACFFAKKHDSLAAFIDANVGR